MKGNSQHQFHIMMNAPHRLFLTLGLAFLASTAEAQSIQRIEITPYREFFGTMPGFPTSYSFNVRVEGTGLNSVTVEALSGVAGPVVVPASSVESDVFEYWSFHGTVEGMQTQWPTGNYTITANAGALSYTVPHAPTEPMSQPLITFPTSGTNPALPFDVQWQPCTGCGGTNMVTTLFQGTSTLGVDMLPAGTTSWTPTGLLPGQDYGLIVGAASVDHNGTLGDGTEYLSSFTYTNSIAFTVDGGNVTPQEIVRLGTPPNPNAFRAGLTGGPAIGNSWFPYVDHNVFTPAATVDFVMLSLQPPLNVPTTIGTLLCFVPPASQIYLTTAGSPFSITVPPQANLIGVQAITQAGSLELGAPHLTNALDIVVGTN